MKNSFTHHLRRPVELAIAALVAALIVAYGLVPGGWSAGADLAHSSAAAKGDDDGPGKGGNGNGGDRGNSGDRGNGTQDPPPDNPPCDADGGHPDHKQCDDDPDNGNGNGNGGGGGGGGGGGNGNDDTCTDGLDNDDDGSIDEYDSECSEGSDGVEDGSDDTADPSCTDGADNDEDGATDEADSECTDDTDGVEDGSDVGTGTGNTCAKGGLTGDATLAEQIAGPGINENGPISGQLHGQLEPPVGPLGPVVHEVSCVVAVVDGAAAAAR